MNLDSLDDLGTVHAIGSSGTNWGSGIAGDIRDLFFNTLRPENVKNRVQISTFTLGSGKDGKSEVQEFFKIITDLLKNERSVVIIANDNESKKMPSCNPDAKVKLKELQKKYPDRFQYYLFNSKSVHAGKILHAKLVVVDRQIALIGSANISMSALSSNYEVMIKISGDVVSRLSLMLDNLTKMLEDESNAN
jgi:phosphatidylserine/phosphatidylglycerophosphate/cardiolipin synthase-like enzyme